MLVLLVMVLSLCGMKQDESEMATMMTTINAATSSETKKNAVVQYYAELHKTGKLTPAFFKKLLERSQNASIVFQALNEFDVLSAKTIYEELLLSSELDDDARLTIALFLSTVTQNSANDELFQAMQRENNLDIAIPLAHAFVNSKKGELQNVAITWAYALRAREFSQQNQERERARPADCRGLPLDCKRREADHERCAEE